MELSLFVGVDTGGTFTDFVWVGPEGTPRTYKVASTPDDPARAVREGLSIVAAGSPIHLVHGSTVATNALLERKGARTIFVTNAGFEDLLRLGRQNRPRLYALEVAPAPHLVADADTVGLAGRLGPDGIELEPMSAAELAALPGEIRARGGEAVAVCLLHAYASDAHERAVAEACATLDLPVSLSSDVLPEYRELERATTTVVNAYVAPKMRDYLGRIGEGLPAGSRLSIMQSNGGSVSAKAAAAQPVRTILSGPAGGVVGAFAAARRAGFERAITFDMGGTSTDVALCDGLIATTSEGTAAGLPVRVPLVDVHTVGAGGGSIATLDPGGALKVGPESAGADPGPACYGRGMAVTVTDAHVVLNRIDAASFLGGRMTISRDRALAAMQALASSMGLSIQDAAHGVLRVANATMEKAIRVISLERGHDPRRFPLVSFGGAGGLHACAIAEALGMSTVVIPPHGGVLSALGMLQADVVRDYARTCLLDGVEVSAERMESVWSPLVERARNEMHADGWTDIRVERHVDCRYRGQSFEVTVPWSDGWEAEFQRAYAARYGYAMEGAGVEIVTARVRATALPVKPDLPVGAPARGVAEPVHTRGGVPRYRRQGLGPGMEVRTPCVVLEDHATTWCPDGWRLRVDESLALILERSEP